MNLSDDLNLELAWKRHKNDLKDMSFSDHPYETKIIDDNFNEWLAKLKEKLNNYKPSRSEIIDIPKKDFHLRPGSIITAEDATVFQALLLYEAQKIRDNLLWSATKDRFAYILKEDQTTEKWFVYEYKGWSNFREQSLKYIDDGYNWVVFADISAYFENISIQRLVSDLKSFGLSKEILTCLSSCLYRWAEPKSRGIPQGNRPSFILAEIYLNSIDRRLKNKKIPFCRYVDDMRLFFKTKEEAILGLHVLTVLMREKELNLQTAKSYILNDDKAREEIDSISKILRNLEDDIKTELKDFLTRKSPYTTPSAIEKYVADIGSSIKLTSIRKAFDDFIINDDKTFNKTLFHYCINRLGAAKDNYAVDYCLKCIINRPEEFIYILPYFSKLKDNRIELAEQMIESFKIESNIFDRHYFLLLRWIYNENISSELILELCRDLAFRSDLDYYTKHYVWAILGEYGDLADLDSIEAEYNKVNQELSRATILCAIKRMVEDRRNSIYARAQADGALICYAIKTSKKNG